MTYYAEFLDGLPQLPYSETKYYLVVNIKKYQTVTDGTGRNRSDGWTEQEFFEDIETLLVAWFGKRYTKIKSVSYEPPFENDNYRYTIVYLDAEGMEVELWASPWEFNSRADHVDTEDV